MIHERREDTLRKSLREPSCSSWMYSQDHGQLCQVIETQTLWGETTCRVWLPGRDSVVRVPASRLTSLENSGTGTADGIVYVASAARVADALTQDLLLAPIESSVIPLPHQIKVLSRAISGDRVRYLLADEVGLGKTIEAGLILRELKLRGLVKKTLIIVPRGLINQWIAEMDSHFDEEIRLLTPNEIPIYRNIAQERNIWRTFPQVICSMDSVKPLEGRQGWTQRQVDEYNQERYEDLISAGWDLIIVDEAHRLAGSTEQVARYKLGKGLSEAAPYLLLLTATPHQGKSDAFHRLVSLLDTQAFPDLESVTRERIHPYVIRTEKRKAIDVRGNPLFKPRMTILNPVAWGQQHNGQRVLYDAVTDYVRRGYNQAIQEKKNYVGFLMLLMQRMVTSSVQAIRMSLEKRFEALELPEEQLTLFPMDTEEEWADMDAQEQVEKLLSARFEGMKNERKEVRLLLDLARRCEENGTDAKAETLLDWIYRLQQEENDPEVKILIFTEFIPTQQMLERYLTDRGFSVACLNGSMNMAERKHVQELFAGDARVLISTDAGGEGLNLQFCHVVINYDIPWNPMKLEQRIGRVDRIGQKHDVRAVNFVLQDTVEHRVREVLEEKLEVIRKEFGVDKTGDVLDSAEAGKIFDRLFVNSILDPEKMEEHVASAVNTIQEEISSSRQLTSILDQTEEFDSSVAQRLMSHPFPHWLEQMTVNYLRAHGGRAERKDDTWSLTWPDGETVERAVFTSDYNGASLMVRCLTLQDERVGRLLSHLPRIVEGQPIPTVCIDGLPQDVRGYWSLWSISIGTGNDRDRRIMPLFIHDDGRCLVPTARRIWDLMLSEDISISSFLPPKQAVDIFKQLLKHAEEQGHHLYRELVDNHERHMKHEREKGAYHFQSRRKTAEQIGLEAVRNFRLSQIEKEEREWERQLQKKADVVPGLEPILIIRMAGSHHD